jgi:uncharacterized protein (TIRG00374 family)
MRSHLKTILLTLVTVALVAWFLRQANFSEVWKEIRGARLDALAMSFVMIALTYLVRAYRWQFLLRPLGRTRFREVFRTTVIGFAANTVLPARVGEVVRPYLLARREHLSVTATFATIILERLLDLVTVVLLLGVFVVIYTPVAPINEGVYRAVKGGGVAAAVTAAVSLAFVAAVSRRPAVVERLSASVAAWLPTRIGARVGHMARMFVHGLAVTRDPVRLFEALAWSVPLWLAIAGGIWFVTVAFHMTMPYIGSFLVLALLVVGVAVPTPGAVGGFHEAFRVAATSFFAVENDRAVGAAIVLHASSFLPVTVVGAIFMLQDGLGLRGVRQLGDEARHAEEAEEDGDLEAAPDAEGGRG